MQNSDTHEKKKTKLKLETLKVQSFVVELDHQHLNKVLGGQTITNIETECAPGSKKPC